MNTDNKANNSATTPTHNSLVLNSCTTAGSGNGTANSTCNSSTSGNTVSAATQIIDNNQLLSVIENLSSNNGYYGSIQSHINSASNFLYDYSQAMAVSTANDAASSSAAALVSMPAVYGNNSATAFYEAAANALASTSATAMASTVTNILAPGFNKAYPSINSAYWQPSPNASPYSMPGMSY